MTRTQIESDYEVVNGRIESLGKFEGEAVPETSERVADRLATWVKLATWSGPEGKVFP